MKIFKSIFFVFMSTYNIFLFSIVAPQKGENLWKIVKRSEISTDNIDKIEKSIQETLATLETRVSNLDGILDQLSNDGTIMEQQLCLINDMVDVSDDLIIHAQEKLEDTGHIVDKIEQEAKDIEGVIDDISVQLDNSALLMNSIEKTGNTIRDKFVTLGGQAVSIFENLYNIEMLSDAIGSEESTIIDSLEIINIKKDAIKDGIDDADEAVQGLLSTTDFLTENIAITKEGIKDVAVVFEDNNERVDCLKETFDDVGDQVDKSAAFVQSIAMVSQDIMSKCGDDKVLGFQLLDQLDTIEDTVNTTHRLVNMLDDIASDFEPREDAIEEKVFILESTVEEIMTEVDVVGKNISEIGQAGESIASRVDFIECSVQNTQQMGNGIESTLEVVESIVDEIEIKIDDIAKAGCCYTINQKMIDEANDLYELVLPGTYCVTESLSLSDAFVIKADYVVLDLGGHNIEIVDKRGDAIIVDNCSQVTVKNGSIYGGNHGIIIKNSAHINVLDLMIYQARENGVYINNAQYLLLQNCTVNRAQKHGFKSNNSFYIIFKECVANESEINGFSLDSDSSHCYFIACKAWENGGYGFETKGDSHVIISSQAYHNNGDGFSLYNGTALVRSIALGNVQKGFVFHGNNTIIRDSIAIKNSQGGMEVFGSASDTALLGNYIASSTGVGIKNKGLNSHIFNNIVHNCDPNLSGVDGVVSFSDQLDKKTGFWTNVGG